MRSKDYCNIDERKEQLLPLIKKRNYCNKVQHLQAVGCEFCQKECKVTFGDCTLLETLVKVLHLHQILQQRQFSLLKGFKQQRCVAVTVKKQN